MGALPAGAASLRAGEPLSSGGRRALLEAFAPVVLLAPGERSLPTSVEWYLARARLERPGRPLQQVSLAEAARTERLRPWPAARGGSPLPADWTVYGHAYRAPDGGVLLQYWFFYAYNVFLGFGDHEADWEHLTVRIDPRGRPLGAWYARHDSNAPGVWTPWESLRRDGAHPVVLSARGSHASYARPDEVSWFDSTCPTVRLEQAARRGCRVWRTWVGSTGGVMDFSARWTRPRRGSCSGRGGGARTAASPTRRGGRPGRPSSRAGAAAAARPARDGRSGSAARSSSSGPGSKQALRVNRAARLDCEHNLLAIQARNLAPKKGGNCSPWRLLCCAPRATVRRAA